MFRNLRHRKRIGVGNYVTFSAGNNVDQEWVIEDREDCNIVCDDEVDERCDNVAAMSHLVGVNVVANLTCCLLYTSDAADE